LISLIAASLLLDLLDLLDLRDTRARFLRPSGFVSVLSRTERRERMRLLEVLAPSVPFKVPHHSMRNDIPLPLEPSIFSRAFSLARKIRSRLTLLFTLEIYFTRFSIYLGESLRSRAFANPSICARHFLFTACFPFFPARVSIYALKRNIFFSTFVGRKYLTLLPPSLHSRIFLFLLPRFDLSPSRCARPSARSVLFEF